MRLSIFLRTGDPVRRRRWQAMAQVKTEVPAVEPSAKPVKVDHIKIHGSRA